jgi:argininosuccinate lyase
MIQASQGQGGPQPAEVERMLGGQRASLDTDRTWVRTARDRLAQAERRRDVAFQALRGRSE